ncbi:hypothetical protein GCM10022251_02580 [Phytohabitans flavus]|uniref:HIT domain-containing protein n=1 Tax=Phytohabitans flavus TaxID=1076124 RepID=A0A6F8Y3Q3_9ACTN|nr:hypothetical protein Pflav_070010 [Phytohabitans flavus]
MDREGGVRPKRGRTAVLNSVRVSLVPDTASPVPDFTKWPSFPFEGDLRVKQLDPPVGKEPSRKGEDAADCSACNAPDDAYIWVSERWRVRAMDRPTGLPMVLILESRSHLDLGDLPNLLAAELGVMTVRLERAVRSLDGVARVHVNRWGDGSAHLHMWFLARPFGRLQLRGTFLSLWDDILPPIPESTWRENLALVAAWLAEFGGKPLAAPPRIEWQAPSSLIQQAAAEAASLAQQTAAEDTSVALLEAPADESTAEDSTADESPAGRAATGAASAANAAAAGVVTTGGPTADRLTGGPAAQGAAATGATRPGLTPGAAGPAAATKSEAQAAGAEADSNAAAVDVASQAPGSQPGHTVPVARSAEQSNAQGNKPEHHGAPS